MGVAAETVRLFFALWPSCDVQAKLAAWAAPAVGRGRPVRQENIHLTLAFLGDTDAALLPDLTALARGVRFEPIRLPLDRSGYWKPKRIIWCATEEDPLELTALVNALRARLDSGAIAYDQRRFISHLTLVRNAAGLALEPAWIPLVWEATDFALVSSTRADGRVTYQILQRFPAAAG